jgi:hypothetical protein
VCLGLGHFRLPVRLPKSPSRSARENPGSRAGAVGRWIVSNGKVAQDCLHYPRVVNEGITRMGSWHKGRRSGST